MTTNATPKTPHTFLITGVSTGLGRAFAEGALAAGHKVIGTLRKESEAAAFSALAPGRSFGRLLDVTHTGELAAFVDQVEKEIGPVDVLVNNAGYGHEGTVEESSLEELRQQMEVNFFGAVAMIKAVLPHMRPRRKGHIVNVTSMGGIITMPGIAFYHASKFALEGLSESLGKEVAGLGIHVTAVEPGGFRTDWAGRSMVRVERKIADYDEVFEPLRERRKGYHGKQKGDPARAATALLALVDMPEPPLHLLLGSDAKKLVADKLEALRAELAAHDALTLSTDHPE
jgi:NAD(P)-dependent dehydrogenase (short-subunit alcohol dehydrogenase family)